MTTDPTFVFDSDVQDIVSKLRFISKIKGGEKIDVGSFTVVEDYILDKMYRTFIGRDESREKTLDFIQKITGCALGMIIKFSNSNNEYETRLGRMILNTLKEARPGISSLIDTYKNDRMYTSKIETLINILDTKIQNLEKISD